jgi:tetratricopeptide (TPR) repeat protein
MISLGSFARAVAVVICGGVLCGCLPAGQSSRDEEKEPHFLAGRSRVNAMDYKGAVESFEKALEANPRSGAAHFELGCLFADKESDPAAAIYHYEQYLKLRPAAENAETVRQLIFRLKQDLAKAILPLPAAPGLQHELDQLADENRRLHDELDKWQAYYRGRGAAPTNPVVAAVATVRAPPASNSVPTTLPAAGQQNVVTTNRATASVAGAMRTHKVQAGENPSSIARQYGLKLDALMAANPGLDPKKLRVGQTLNIPSP